MSYLTYQKERERFFGGQNPSNALAPNEYDPKNPDQIFESWRRSHKFKVAQVESEIDWAEIDPQHILVRHAKGPIKQLTETLQGLDVGIVIAESNSRILARYEVTTRAGDLLDTINLAAGFNYSENSVGTNGIGTVVETRRPIYVRGTAHYQERFDNYACAGAPIKHPITGEIIGVLDLTADLATSSPFLLSLAQQTAAHIGHALKEAASIHEIHTLNVFLRATKVASKDTGVIVQDGDLNIKNEVAKRILSFHDADEIVAKAKQHTASQSEASFLHHSSCERKIFLARTRRIDSFDSPLESSTNGVIICVTEAALNSDRESALAVLPTQQARVTASKLETSSAKLARREVHDLLQSGRNLVVIGETGAGKKTLIKEALATLRPRQNFVQLVAGGKDIKARIAEKLKTLTRNGFSMPVLVSDIHLSSQQQLQDISSLLRNPIVAGHPLQLLLTADSKRSDSREMQAILPYLHSMISLAPLRERQEDIGVLVKHFLKQKPESEQMTVSVEALNMLQKGGWSGNIRQLEASVSAAVAHALERGSTILTVSDFSSNDFYMGRRRLSPIEIQEREAIVKALHEFDQNRTAAAKFLGLSRATFYRKMKFYEVH